MGILIPSKCIYDIKYSPIVENTLEKIEVPLNKFYEVFTTDTLLYQNSFDVSKKYVYGEPNLPADGESGSFQYIDFKDNYEYKIYESSGVHIALAGIKRYEGTIVVKIPAKSDSYVVKQGYAKVTVRKKFQVYEPNGMLDFSYSGGSQISQVDKLQLNYENYPNVKTPETFYETPPIPNKISANTQTTNYNATYELETDADQFDVYLIESDQKGYFEAHIPIYTSTIEVIINQKLNTSTVPQSCQANIKHYKLTGVDVTINGETFSIEQEQENISVSNNEIIENSISFSGNKLFQSKYQSDIKDNLIKVLEEYQDGKEIAQINCSISNYYDENGNLVVSKNGENGKMAFSIYDKVIPYVRNNRGEDTPLSVNENGEAKSFNVIGTRILYDGAVWQELDLQEAKIEYILRALDGTAGLSYRISNDESYYICDGIGDAVDKNITIGTKFGYKYNRSKPITTISEGAFYNNQNLESVIIPDSIITVGNSAFLNCNSIQSLTLGEGIQTIDRYAFAELLGLNELNYNCKEIVSQIYTGTFSSLGANVGRCFLNIGENVQIIPENLFSSAGSTPYITDIYFHKDSICKSIRYGAFIGCKYLSLIILPKSIKNIELDAFYGTSLREVFYLGSENDWNKIGIGDGNISITNATRYYYSETQPSTSGKYWRYVNGRPSVWY